MKYPTTKCTECKQEFKFKPRIKRIGGIEIIYTECNHCKARYLSYVTNSQIRQRLMQTEKMRRQISIKKFTGADVGVIGDLTRSLNSYIETTRQMMKDCAVENNRTVSKVIERNTNSKTK